MKVQSLHQVLSPHQQKVYFKFHEWGTRFLSIPARNWFLLSWLDSGWAAAYITAKNKEIPRTKQILAPTSKWILPSCPLGAQAVWPTRMTWKNNQATAYNLRGEYSKKSVWHTQQWLDSMLAVVYPVFSLWSRRSSSRNHVFQELG